MLFISFLNFQSRYGRSVYLLLYYYRVLQHDSVTFLNLIQATDVVIRCPKEVIQVIINTYYQKWKLFIGEFFMYTHTHN